MSDHPDLMQATILMVAFSSLAAVAGALSARQTSKATRVSVQLFAVAALLLYLGTLWNRPILATMLPASSLIILGNWLPLWACFFVGIYLATSHRLRIRQFLLSTLAVLFAVVSVVAPMFGETPKCEVNFGQPMFQYQTSPYTCSAASATTLLRLHGITATEQEMADLALTRKGTHWMGVYRALKLKTQDTGWSVVVETIQEGTQPDLHPTPALLALNFDPEKFPSGVDHGFSELTGHSVISLGTGGDQYVDVFDPTPDFGFERWGAKIWNCAESGVVLRLVPVDEQAVSVADVQRRVAQSRRQGTIASR